MPSGQTAEEFIGSVITPADVSGLICILVSYLADAQGQGMLSALH
jgi:hypothetical protein